MLGLAWALRECCSLSLACNKYGTLFLFLGTMASASYDKTYQSLVFFVNYFPTSLDLVHYFARHEPKMNWYKILASSVKLLHNVFLLERY